MALNGRANRADHQPQDRQAGIEQAAQSAKDAVVSRALRNLLDAAEATGR
jgi:hypothetical protein